MERCDIVRAIACEPTGGGKSGGLHKSQIRQEGISLRSDGAEQNRLGGRGHIKNHKAGGAARSQQVHQNRRAGFKVERAFSAVAVQIGIAKFAIIDGSGDIAGIDDDDPVSVADIGYVAIRPPRCWFRYCRSSRLPTRLRKLGGAVPEPETESTAEALTKPPTVITIG